MIGLRIALLLILSTLLTFAQDHLLISEVVVTPTVGEYVEIYNPTSATISLDQYYITDATNVSTGNYYYNIVTGASAGGDLGSDFHLQFPVGATIAPGEYQTIATNGTEFLSTYGVSPTYEMESVEAGVTDMVIAFGTITGSVGITNSHEVIILYQWDGQSDLVTDVDYLVWGDKSEAVDKSGVVIDGPDADGDGSAYLNDTPIASQISASSGTPHADGESLQRLTLSESGETQTGGNGTNGHDETSEDLATAFSVTTVTPNSGPPASAPPSISNLTRTPIAPTETDSVLIQATVTDDIGLSGVFLFYNVNGGALDSVAMSVANVVIYSASIAPRAVGDSVAYFIRATDTDNQNTVSVTASYTVGEALTLTAIADIQANPSAFSVVLVEGIVTLGAGRTTPAFTSAYIQDNSGRGINIFQSGTIDAAFERGNEVQVLGMIDEFNGVTEIVDYTVSVLSTGNAVPDPLPISTAQLNGSVEFEGTYVEMTGNISDIAGGIGGGTNITVNDGSGAATVRVWDDTGIDLSALSVGNDATFRGVFGLFNNLGQLVPGYQDEIVLPGQNPGDGSGVAVISPDTVGFSEALTADITLTGEGSFVLEQITIEVPAEWTWSGQVAVNGAGFSNALTSVSDRVITISDAAISATDAGTVSISSLTSPASSVTSTFFIRTATAGGTPVAIAGSPTITTGSGGEPTTPIADIQANPAGFDEVTIEAIVTQAAGATGGTLTSAYVQDESGRGINVFDFDSPSTPPNDLLIRGHRLRITGTVEEFVSSGNTVGVTEITDYTIDVVSTGNDIPAPLILSPGTAGDVTLEGTYVQVTGIVTDLFAAGGGTNITLTDPLGDVVVRVWDASNLDLSFIALGDTLVSRGVMGIFRDETQIVSAYQDELAIFGENVVVGDGSGLAEVSPATAGVSTTTDVLLKVYGEDVDTLTTLEVLLPFNWGWSGDANQVTLAGAGLNGASLEIRQEFDERYLIISNAAVTRSDSALISISGLTTPDHDAYAYFWIKTAVAGGTPKFMDDNPRFTVGSNPRYQIRDIQTYPPQFSDAITLEGIVTVGAGVIRTDRTSAYFQDESGFGLNINRAGAPDNRYQRGFRVRITGVIDEFAETTQINPSTVTILDSNNVEPEPVRLSTAEAFSARWDGTLVEVSGLITDKFTTSVAPPLDYNIVVNDGSGPLTLRIWATTLIDVDEFQEGDAMIARGIGNVFIGSNGREYQLLPGYQDHLQLDPNYQPSLETVGLEVPASPFAPELGETFPITYDAGAIGNQVSIRIYDLGGRLITTLLEESASLIRNSIQWDGRDRLRDLVPIGTYICHLQSVESVSGRKRDQMVPIVVATRLK